MQPHRLGDEIDLDHETMKEVAAQARLDRATRPGQQGSIIEHQHGCGAKLNAADAQALRVAIASA